MSERIPILIDGGLSGYVNIFSEGRWTVFEAECRMIDGLLRLSVYGEGGEGYLGVMAPENGVLRLRKRLSPAEMRAFPGLFSEAGPAGKLPESGTGPPPLKKNVPTEPDGLYWYSSPDGELVCFDGNRSLAALPIEPGVILPPDGVERLIEGRRYMVYTKTR